MHDIVARAGGLLLTLCALYALFVNPSTRPFEGVCCLIVAALSFGVALCFYACFSNELAAMSERCARSVRSLWPRYVEVKQSAEAGHCAAHRELYAGCHRNWHAFSGMAMTLLVLAISLC